MYQLMNYREHIAMGLHILLVIQYIILQKTGSADLLKNCLKTRRHATDVVRDWTHAVENGQRLRSFYVKLLEITAVTLQTQCSPLPTAESPNSSLLCCYG